MSAVTGEVAASVDVGEDGTVQASTFKAKLTGSTRQDRGEARVRPRGGRAGRSTDSRHPTLAMPVTGRPRREVRLKGAQRTPPRPRQGGPRDERFVSRGRSERLGPGSEGRKRDDRFV